MSIWETYAIFYNLVLDEFFPYQKLVEDLIGSLKIEEKDHILDAGCGPGFLIRKIIEKNKEKNLKILGVDLSPRMINYAQSRCIGLPEVDFKIADLNKDFNFLNKSFDKIICLNTLYALQDPQNVIKRFYQALNPGGNIIISNPKPKPEGENIMKEQIRALLDMKPAYKKIFHWLVFSLAMPIFSATGIINKIILEKGKKGEYHFLSKEEIKNFLKKAGFKNVEISLVYADQNWLAKGSK